MVCRGPLRRWRVHQPERRLDRRRRRPGAATLHLCAPWRDRDRDPRPCGAGGRLSGFPAKGGARARRVPLGQRAGRRPLARRPRCAVRCRGGDRGPRPGAVAHALVLLRRRDPPVRGARRRRGRRRRHRWRRHGRRRRHGRVERRRPAGAVLSRRGHAARGVWDGHAAAGNARGSVCHDGRALHPAALRLPYPVRRQAARGAHAADAQASAGPAGGPRLP
mmetsp:Transcript_22419/g.73177  ORF Transcript_22419/g.73177 Transcript_22419/m.73177 type:complete len:220 (+) Transcript_22419:380-1039(+)